MIRKMIATAILAFGFAAPVSATNLNAMTDPERAAFRAEVRAYLLENPEVLMEAISILDQRQASQKAADDVALVTTNAADLFHDGFSWVGGNPNGDVTLVEFRDYRCAYCRKAHDEVAELVKSDGNIRFIIKEFPILGEQSTASSRFAIATQQLAGQDAYEKVAERLIKFRGKVTNTTLGKLADKYGLDGKAIIARMNSPKVDAVINANHALGQRLQISGTPTFVLGDQMLRGYVPLAGMRTLVSQVRAN